MKLEKRDNKERLKQIFRDDEILKNKNKRVKYTS